MFKRILPVFLLVLCVTVTSAQNRFKADPQLLKTIDQNMADAAKQYHYMMTLVPADSLPKTFHPTSNKSEFSDSGWWCSGFYSGTLFYIYQFDHDKSLLVEANKRLALLNKEQYNTGTHDLGFMMYCSYGNANRLEPSEAYKQVLINSAKSLSTRFNPVVGCIKSWNRGKDDFTVIIDNMMNLELLFWATQTTGDSSFYKIAVTHANTTMKNHFRPDYSSYHVLNYDPQTGAVKERKTAQGYSNESAWARGQSWGLYGYTMCYRETHDKKYLDQAEHIASFILNNPNLPADKVPYWDFNAPDIPNALRDASAASVMASALLELAKYADGAKAQLYYHTAEQILRSLSSVKYKATNGTNGGYLLMHSVGNKPGGTEIDTPLTYADYYFVEAMERYVELSKK